MLILLGCVVGVAALEGMLRAGGALYSLRQQTANRVSLERDSTYRILCLGESTTAGLAWGQEAYPPQLERILNERAAGRATFSVINGGLVATTTDVLLAKLPANLEKFDPQIVVAMMGINDGQLRDSEFQVGGTLRVWKLAKMLYYAVGKQLMDSTSGSRLVNRAEAALPQWPAVAAELAERAIRASPQDPRPFLILAMAQLKLGNPEQAEQSFSQAFERDPAAVVVQSYLVRENVIDRLDRTLSRFPKDPDALVSRAILALRRNDFGGTRSLARQALEIDPDSVVALIVEGRALQVVGTIREAESRYEKAVALNRRLVDLLATQPLTDSWVLRDVMARAPSGAAAPETAADEGLERWLAGAKEDRNKRYERLRLKGNWQKMARGEIQAATDDLEDVVDTAPAGEQQFRLAALGQLAILQWQAGNPHRAEQYQERIEAFLAESENPVTRENYRKLRRVLRQRGVQLVAVQYPMRRLEPLKRLLGSAPEVVFVDNEQIFERALLGRPHAEIFHDLFAGNFGHMTPLGNRLLAENVADTILALVAERGAG